MNKQELEQEKIALTKQYEKLQQEINTYTIGKIAVDWWRLKELSDKKDAVEFRIREIKKILDS